MSTYLTRMKARLAHVLLQYLRCLGPLAAQGRTSNTMTHSRHVICTRGFLSTPGAPLGMTLLAVTSLEETRPIATSVEFLVSTKPQGYISP